MALGTGQLIHIQSYIVMKALIYTQEHQCNVTT